MMLRSLRLWFASVAGACCLGVALPSPAPAVETQPQRTELGRYYSRLEAQLRARGYLRQDRIAADAPFTAEMLTRDFMTVALRQEYRGGSLVRRGGEKPLLRWEQPVRLAVAFGASVSPAQQRHDRQMINSFAERLYRTTRHPVHVVRGRPNFHVLVVSDAERRGLGPFLRANVPGISQSAINAVLSMRRNHFCMVVAVPHADRSRGYRSAVAIVRAEHSAVMRQSCIQEELAQGMGLPNDCREARPSIFNDNEEFGVLTRHDEMLLSILYDPSLRSGMAADQAMPIVRQLASRHMTR